MLILKKLLNLNYYKVKLNIYHFLRFIFSINFYYYQILKKLNSYLKNNENYYLFQKNLKKNLLNSILDKESF